MVVGCELCGSPANTYCESDQARLCWSCDGNVHAANFLVAKHSRSLLCHHCQAQTPWSASGPQLTPSCAFCVSCVDSKAHVRSQHLHPQLEDHEDHDNVSYDDNDDDDNDDDDDHLESLSDDDEDDDDDDDEEENQVVPWAVNPPEMNESEAEDYNSNGGLLKRKREFAFLNTPSVLFQF